MKKQTRQKEAVSIERDAELGGRIHEFRSERGLTLAGLAARVGVTRSFLSSVERGIAYAAGNEIDEEAAGAIRGVSSAHFVSELAPLVKSADARGEFAPGTEIDQVVAMVVLLLRHLDKAPFYRHVDPILDLTEKRPAEVERIALELVDALERAYGRPRRRRGGQ